MTEIKLQRGIMLLAEPFMGDPHFKRSAVLLCEHNQEGSLGFILNRPLDLSVSGLIQDFPEIDAEVFYGGPVQNDTIHYLHDLGDVLDDSIEVADGVYWGGDFEKLKALISSKLVQPENIRFFVGYSGWSPGQLAEEMKYGSWMVADSYANYIFKSDPDQLWSEVMHNKGGSYTVLAQMPDSISWN